MIPVPLNPYEEPPHFSLEDRENGKTGRLDIRFAFFSRTMDHETPVRDDAGAPVIDTAAILTKIVGYGTSNIAQTISRFHIGFIQERSVTEFIVFHHWLQAEAYSIQAKESMFRLIAHPLIRRRLKESRILVQRGLFSSMVEAGLRLSGVSNAHVVNSEATFHKDIAVVLQRYGQRTGSLRIPVEPALIPK